MAGPASCSGMASTETPQRWDCAVTSFYDQAVHPANRVMRVRDTMLVAWQLRRGTVELAASSGRLCAGPGDWLLIAPGTARTHRFSDDAAIRSIRCLVRDGSGRLPGAGVAPRVVTGGAPDLNGPADALAAVLAAGDAGGLPEWAERQAAILRWCAAACRRLGIDGRVGAREARVVAAQEELRRHPAPGAVPWAALRRATGLSRPQLDRLFRHHAGTSVRGWREDRLLADACAALGDPAEPVKAVAARLGFGDASHFCRWFRRVSGTSPADWRRRGGA